MKKAFLFLFPTLLFSCTEKEQFITLSDSDVTIFYDGSKQLSVNYSSDELKSKTYNYSTSDSTVVKVNESGLVSGVCIGSAIVKISSNDGKYNDECRFTVSPKSTLYKEPYTVYEFYFYVNNILIVIFIYIQYLGLLSQRLSLKKLVLYIQKQQPLWYILTQTQMLEMSHIYLKMVNLLLH